MILMPKASLRGMTHETNAVDLVHPVLEGVTFALLDGLDAVRSVQNISESIDVIGGGAKSTYWLRCSRMYLMCQWITAKGAKLVRL